jgi:hypothetical protein
MIVVAYIGMLVVTVGVCLLAVLAPEIFARWSDEDDNTGS